MAVDNTLAFKSDLPPGSPGWEFVAYGTATGASSITISDLDLSTDKRYEVFVKYNNKTSTGQVFTMKFNSATTNYKWMGNRVFYNASAGSERREGTGGTYIPLDGWNTYNSNISKLDISLLESDGTNTRIFCSFQTTGAGQSGNKDYMQSFVGSCTQSTQSNLTSLVFANTSGTTTDQDWEVFIQKPTTS